MELVLKGILPRALLAVYFVLLVAWPKQSDQYAENPADNPPAAGAPKRPSPAVATLVDPLAPDATLAQAERDRLLADQPPGEAAPAGAELDRRVGERVSAALHDRLLRLRGLLNYPGRPQEERARLARATLETADRLLARPDAPRFARLDALYHRAITLDDDLNDFAGAQAAFDTFLKEFPDEQASRYARDRRERIAALLAGDEGRLTVELRRARDEFLSDRPRAMERLEGLLRDHRNSPQANEIRRSLIDCYVYPDVEQWEAAAEQVAALRREKSFTDREFLDQKDYLIAKEARRRDLAYAGIGTLGLLAVTALAFFPWRGYRPRLAGTLALLLMPWIVAVAFLQWWYHATVVGSENSGDVRAEDFRGAVVFLTFPMVALFMVGVGLADRVRRAREMLGRATGRLRAAAALLPLLGLCGAGGAIALWFHKFGYFNMVNL
ncbi:MAG: hypothetical protein HY719_11015 [Planctomycetes bacterium]|nr:hypothetical protein [Planctomycetota bacterium]